MLLWSCMLPVRCHLLLLAAAVGLWLLHMYDKLDWLALLLQCRLLTASWFLSRCPMAS